VLALGIDAVGLARSIVASTYQHLFTLDNNQLLLNTPFARRLLPNRRGRSPRQRQFRVHCFQNHGESSTSARLRLPRPRGKVFVGLLKLLIKTRSDGSANALPRVALAQVQERSRPPFDAGARCRSGAARRPLGPVLG
jgi:hypothetical protein